jgi:ceramide glucosyltransferase
MPFIEFLCLIPVVCGSVYVVVCLVAVLRTMRRPGRPSTFGTREWPAVTILKPVCGLEKGLWENLRSACLQDYPSFQVVFSVQRPDDPAIPLLDELQEQFGPKLVTVAIEECLAGPNGKVNNLIGGLKRARHDVLVISDSDVRLRPDYLRTIVAPLENPDVGFVCTFFKATAAESWFERMELLTMNASFFPDAVFAYFTKTAKFCIGSSIAFRRSVLKDIGGFESLADYLVEDYEMGRRIWQQGKRPAVAPYAVELVIDLRNPSQWWNHQVYWDQNSCIVRPGALISTLIIRPLPFAVLFAVLRQFDPLGVSILAGVLAVRLATAAGILGVGLRDREGLKSLPLLPFRDMAAVLSLILAFTKKTTVWRENEFVLTRDGHMIPREVSLCKSSS